MSDVPSGARGTLLLGAAMSLVSLSPSSAFAFDTFDSFAAPVLGVAAVPPADPPVEPVNGGGDGRYFTGSIADGFSCSVCHYGGNANAEDFEMEIIPDPFEDGYVAGDVYEIVITVRDLANWAATLELVDTQGQGAGDLELVALGPEPGDDAQDKCGDGAVPSHIIELPNLADPARQAREVAGIDVCVVGSPQQFRVTWEAPETATGGVWLNAAIVAGDGSGDAAGDHTVLIARMIAPFGTAPESGRVTNSCAASAGGGSPLPWFGFLALALIWLGRRRRTPAGPQRPGTGSSHAVRVHRRR